MELLAYYLIGALSFSIMYTIQYGWEITQIVLDVLNEINIDYREDRKWDPVIYNILLFLTVLFIMPIFLYVVLTQNRYETVKDAASYIIEKNYIIKK